MSSCEAAIWDVASWIVKNVDERQLVAMLETPQLNYNQRYAMQESGLKRLLNDNKEDTTLSAALGVLGTNPKTLLSGMRSGFSYVEKAYASWSSLDPTEWFDRYKEQVLEMDVATQRSSTRVSILVPVIDAEKVAVA